MTLEQLQRGKKISDQMEEIAHCIEAIERHKNDDLKVIVTDFLNAWRNVGSGKIKDKCAVVAFNAILEHLRNELTALQNEFNGI